MNEAHFQEEETYLFSSLLDRLRELSQKEADLATKCLLAVFWKVYGETRIFKALIRDIENEIQNYDSDPTRESNRLKKIFICAIYKAIVEKVRYDKKLQNYFSYVKKSRNWLGELRIACCLSFLEDDSIGKDAKSYLKENFGTWFSDGRDEFIAIALLALRNKMSKGDLQRILEYVESRINDLPLNIISLFLIGISQSNSDLPNKDVVEDKLYQAIKDQIKEPASCNDEEIISAASALFLSKYHKISGYFDKYSAELKETLALKDYYREATKKAKTRNLLLFMSSIVTIGLVCLMFFLPSLVQFKDNPSAFGKLLLTLNTIKSWAFASSLVLVAYILVSYLKKGDPVSGIIEYVQEKFPGLFKINKER